MQQFDNNKFYVVSGSHMNLIVNVALRLFSENKLKSDEYRDNAQQLEYAIESAFEYTNIHEDE